MSLGVNVNISGDAKFMAKLNGLKDLADLGDFHAALNKVGDELVRYYSGQAWESEGGVFGTPWAHLAPSTQAYKIKHYAQYSALPLQASGAMRASFTKQAGPRKLIISNAAPYFVYHQSSAPRTKLPRRQMMGINNPIKSIIKVIITADVEAKLAVL